MATTTNPFRVKYSPPASRGPRLRRPARCVSVYLVEKPEGTSRVLDNDVIYTSQ
jgi:hypothetical protein